jgi:hypothetical protein
VGQFLASRCRNPAQCNTVRLDAVFVGLNRLSLSESGFGDAPENFLQMYHRILATGCGQGMEAAEQFQLLTLFMSAYLTKAIAIISLQS